jgi:hypothetical protein
MFFESDPSISATCWASPQRLIGCPYADAADTDETVNKNATAGAESGTTSRPTTLSIMHRGFCHANAVASLSLTNRFKKRKAVLALQSVARLFVVGRPRPVSSAPLV